MKKAVAVLSVFLSVILLSACLPNLNNTTDTESEVTSLTETTVPQSTTAAPTDAVTTAATTAAATTEPSTAKTEPGTKNEYKIITGAPGGNTFTGFAPLPERRLNVTDPDNTRGLSTKANGYGFGVGKNGVPPAQSLNNQKIFNKYDALAIEVNPAGKPLYLTFDCGYENGLTGSILDTLKAKNVPAAFFCTLPYIKQQTALVTRMINEGHIVGNHSNTHPVFPQISRTQMAKEIEVTDNYLRTRFGYSAPYFRFPTGSYSDCALDLVQSVGFKSVFWSLAYRDWETDKQQGAKYAFDTVTSRLHPGAVILLHAVSSDNAAALGDIIDWARNRGYEFKSL